MGLLYSIDLLQNQRNIACCGEDRGASCPCGSIPSTTEGCPRAAAAHRKPSRSFVEDVLRGQHVHPLQPQVRTRPELWTRAERLSENQSHGDLRCWVVENRRPSALGWGGLLQPRSFPVNPQSIFPLSSGGWRGGQCRSAWEPGARWGCSSQKMDRKLQRERKMATRTLSGLQSRQKKSWACGFLNGEMIGASGHASDFCSLIDARRAPPVLL